MKVLEYQKQTAVQERGKGVGGVRKSVRLGDIAQINPRFNKSLLVDETPVSFVPMAAVGAPEFNSSSKKIIVL